MATAAEIKFLYDVSKLIDAAYDLKTFREGTRHYERASEFVTEFDKTWGGFINTTMQQEL